MIVGLIVACEVGFWVLLAAGLAVRYLLRMPRTGLVLLLCEPVLELVLFAATAVDLRNGAEPGWEHGLAALYIGFTVGYGHHTVRRLDAYAAHRLDGAPRPPRPPKYGMPRARHEGRLWLRTVTAGAVAWVLLQAAVRYVGDVGDVSSLRSFQALAVRIVVVHGVIALTYLLWPKRPAKGTQESSGAAERSPGRQPTER